MKPWLSPRAWVAEYLTHAIGLYWLGDEDGAREQLTSIIRILGPLLVPPDRRNLS